MNPRDTPWHKSSYSGPHGDNCVEIANLPSGVAMRDSQNPNLGHLTISITEWSAVLAALGRGEL